MDKPEEKPEEKKEPIRKMDSPSSSSLSDLDKHLYAREQSPMMKERRDELKQLGIKRTVLPPDDETNKTPVSMRDVAGEQVKKRNRIIKWSLFVVILLGVFGAALGGTLWYRARHDVTPNQIHLAIEAPSAFTAGDAITYKITYENTSLENWINVDVAFEAPAGFSFSSSTIQTKNDGKQLIATLGNVKSGQKGSFEIHGYLLGEMNASVVAQAKMRVTPENFPSGQFEKAALSTTTITTVPLDLSIDLQRKATKGERLVATIKLTNTSANTVKAVHLKLIPNPGMQLVTSDPGFSTGFSVTDAEWQIPSIDPLQTLTYIAIVNVDGQPNEERILQVQAGIKPADVMYVQRDLSSTVTIISSSLGIEQTYNDSSEPIMVAAGDKIEGVIKYANTGTTGLTDVIIRAKIEGEGLDPATLDLKNGGYDPTTQTITWTAASLPDLAVLQPNQSGEIKYAFQIYSADNFPKDAQVKNHAVIITASIDSPSIITPVGEAPKVVSDSYIISINSELTLVPTAYYDDGRLGITSTGPVPPKVGQQTTYTLRLSLGSTLNDAGDVRVSITLPDGVKYTDQKLVTLGDISFNERSQEIDWTIPKLDGQTGRTAPAAELYLQVAITPGENQRGDAVTLLNKVSAIGTDLFTNKEIQTELKTENMPTTETASPNQGKVE